VEVPVPDAHRSPTAGKDEYIDLSTNLRHWNTLRFAELTIFIALTGGLLNVLYIGKAAQMPQANLVMKGAGILVSIIFYLLHERTMAWWHAFLTRAIAIESDLGYRQYSDVPRTRIITGTNVVRAFYLVILAFWVASLIWPA
jgi:hypothetical protein